MIIEATLVALVVGAYRKAGKKGILTEERERIYLDALENLLVPSKLIELSNVYEKEGLPVHAKMLRARANLRAMSPDIAKRRREVYDMAMKSTNPIAIERVALAFESQTATGAAKSLREHAAKVRAEQTKMNGKTPQQQPGKTVVTTSEENHGSQEASS